MCMSEGGDGGARPHVIVVHHPVSCWCVDKGHGGGENMEGVPLDVLFHGPVVMVAHGVNTGV